MNSQHDVMVSVLVALAIHIVVACMVLWKMDTEKMQFAEIEQGIEISLDRNTYQRILQKQQDKKQQVLEKKEAPKPIKPKTIKVKKQKKVQALKQKAMREVQKVEVVTYKVQEQEAEEVTSVTETASHVPQEAVKVASTTDTPIQTARLDSPPSKAGEGGAANQKTLDMNDSATRRYLAQLMQHLKRYKQYPAQLKKNHIEGKPVIRFSINKSGHVTNVEVKRHSNNAELDQTAMDVFRRASPLPKIPSELERETLTMSLPIEYSLIND